MVVLNRLLKNLLNVLEGKNVGLPIPLLFENVLYILGPYFVVESVEPHNFVNFSIGPQYGLITIRPNCDTW